MHESAADAAVLDEAGDEVHDLRVQDGRNLKVFAGGGGSGENEDAGADNGADSQCRQ